MSDRKKSSSLRATACIVRPVALRPVVLRPVVLRPVVLRLVVLRLVVLQLVVLRLVVLRLVALRLPSIDGRCVVTPNGGANGRKGACTNNRGTQSC